MNERDPKKHAVITWGPVKILKQKKKDKKPGIHVKIISPITKSTKCGCLVFLGNNKGTLTTDAELEAGQIIVKSQSNEKMWSAIVVERIDTVPGKSVPIPLTDVHQYSEDKI